MRNGIVSTAFLFVLVQGSCVIAQTPAAVQSNPAVAKTIHQIYLDEQADLSLAKPGEVTTVTLKEYIERSEARRQQVRAMLAADEVKTGEDFHDASLLFQHGENPDDYLLAHVLAVEAVIKGDDRSKWMAAATLDRYLQMINKPQVFGTQYPLDPNASQRPTVDTQSKFNENFKGRTQIPFNDQLLMDSIRLDFCVPTLAQQKLNLATFNSGKYPGSSMVAPGCKR